MHRLQVPRTGKALTAESPSNVHVNEMALSAFYDMSFARLIIFHPTTDPAVLSSIKEVQIGLRALKFVFECGFEGAGV